MAKDQNIIGVEFRGEMFDVNKAALHSMKVQKAMLLVTTNQAAAFDAMDKICCGNLDDYLDRIPEEDGKLSEFGASDEALGAFLEAAAIASSAKN